MTKDAKELQSFYVLFDLVAVLTAEFQSVNKRNFNASSDKTLFQLFLVAMFMANGYFDCHFFFFLLACLIGCRSKLKYHIEI